MDSFEEIFNRLYLKLGINKDSDFREKFNISASTLSTWKKRNSIPYEKIIEIAKDENISLDYVLKGIEKNISSEVMISSQIINNQGSIGDRIKEAREFLNINQNDFAELLNLAPQSLSRYEKNKVTPSIDFITKLSQQFNINSNWLINGTGEILLQVIQKTQNIGERIKESRNHANLTQDELCLKINKSKRTLVSYEKNESEPTVDTVLLISEVCNVDKFWLLTGENNIPQIMDYKEQILKNLEKLNENQIKFIFHSTEIEILKNIKQ